MSIRLKPLANKLVRTFGQERSLSEAAVETVIEQIQEIEHHRPPLFLPGQLEKAKQGSPGHQSLSNEIAQATKIQVVHQPVVRYTIENCLVHAAGLDFSGGTFRIQHLKGSMLASTRIQRMPKALYCMTGVSHTFFGHWLQDACATALLKRENEALLLTNPSHWPHAAQYVQAFGFDPEPIDMIRVDQLTVYQDVGQGSSKRFRYRELRERLEKAYPKYVRGNEKVYFRRGSTGVARLIQNEDMVVESLRTRGFEVFDLLNASVEDIAACFRKARFIVSVDGSHLNHLYFLLQPGAKLVTLIPADCFTMNQVGYCAAAGMNYGFLVMDGANGAYQVSIEDLNGTLDLMGL